ncbi:MAG: immunity protein Imm33 domain-containing protein [Myxococcota bacterium]
MVSFTTTGCGAHGHPDFTVQFAEKPLIPHGERLLLDYFESAVSSGTKFKAGQTVGVGSHVLRLTKRADGTLGVEEPIPSPNEEWVEAVDRTVREVTFQRWICDSVGLELSFPPPQTDVLVAACAEGAENLVLTRLAADELGAGFSGWMLACAADHDHGERHQLPLLALSAMHPFCVQFLALPPEVVVLLTPPGHGHVFFKGKQLEPRPRSYLSGLNAR